MSIPTCVRLFQWLIRNRTRARSIRTDVTFAVGLTAKVEPSAKHGAGQQTWRWASLDGGGSQGGQSVDLMLAASKLANGAMAWTLCAAMIDEGVVWWVGIKMSKGTHLHGKGEKRSRLNVRKPSEMVDSFYQLFR
jgi:hypothetical protein